MAKLFQEQKGLSVADVSNSEPTSSSDPMQKKSQQAVGVRIMTPPGPIIGANRVAPIDSEPGDYVIILSFMYSQYYMRIHNECMLYSSHYNISGAASTRGDHTANGDKGQHNVDNTGYMQSNVRFSGKCKGM